LRLDSRGYNLIELMVVVAVLAALFAIAIPNYYAMKARTLEAVTEVNMYDFQLAIIHFSIDHAGLYPTPADDAEIKAGMKGGVYPENAPVRFPSCCGATNPSGSAQRAEPRIRARSKVKAGFPGANSTMIPPLWTGTVSAPQR
jgi:prepilin-type N-terminal cleavage/methylation domain-containing protein